MRHYGGMISVVIPTVNSERLLPRCFDSLITAAVRGVVREVIVSDCGSTDATLAIADAAGAHIVNAKKGRSTQLAQAGSYQQMLGGKQYQMMQVRVADRHFIPEMSANKYMLWVRFTTQDGDLKPRPAEQDVPFELTLCNF